MGNIMRFILGEAPEPARDHVTSKELHAQRLVEIKEMKSFEMELDAFTTRRTMDLVADMREYRKFKARNDAELDEHLQWLQRDYTERQVRRLRGEY